MLKLTFLTLVLFSLEAVASLQVFPLRVDLNTREKTSSVTVRNRGDAPMTYQVSLVYYEQDLSGQMRASEKPDTADRSLTPHVRFSPRRVTLAAGESQVVRLMVRPRSELGEGDYRAHIRFEPLGSMKPSTGQETSMQMQLEARVAVNIPILYRHGQPTGTIDLKDFVIRKDEEHGHVFDVKMVREGPIFPMGVFRLYHVDNKEDMIGLVKGVSSYRDERQFIFRLDKEPEKKGRYILEFLKDEFEQTPITTTEFHWNG